VPTTSKKGGRPVRKEEVAARLLSSLDGGIRPVRAGFLYRLGLLLVAVTMLVLPLIYLSLIAAVAYGVYRHIIVDVVVLERVQARAALIAYVGPIIVGVLLLVFMLKPLVSRKRETSIPVSLRREEEPVLFEFVDRLCRAVGAPEPRRIDVTMDVNAAAGFMGGLGSLFGRKLVLTFGLPLVACLDARQFAGVLAHELGHFSQGSAMRLTYIIRSMNAWFARVVYQRDSWDYALADACGGDMHYLIQLIALITRGMIWITRRILWCLMWLGHAASSLMLRQMEFDADRYECRVAGTQAFIETSQRMACMNVACAVAFGDLNHAWREQRLCDDLPALIRGRETEMPAEVREEVLKHHAGNKAGWFDSHPSDGQRIAAARREDAPGLMTRTAPAWVLFRSFPDLSRLATLLFYKQQIGPAFKPQHLMKTQAMVETRTERQKTYTSMDRYFRGLIAATRPVFPSMATSAPDEHRAAENLLQFRSKLWELESGALKALRQWDETDKRATTLAVARELRTAGFRKSGAEDPSVDAMSDDTLRAAEVAANREKAKAAEVVNRALDVVLERMGLALALERARAERAKPAAMERDDFGEYDLAGESAPGSDDIVLAALNALRIASGEAEALRSHTLALGALLSHIRPTGNSKPLVDAVLWHSRKAAGRLREIYQNVSGVSFPYKDSGKPLPLSQYLIRGMPQPEQVGQVAAASRDALEAYYSLYLRMMADLAQRAERIETELGLPQLEKPAQSELEKAEP
jgi:Zn-dependent protease with chaperone function